MAISESHAAHIRRVKVGFIAHGPDLDPDALSRSLGLSPTRQASRGDPRRNAVGDQIGVESESWWRLDSVPNVESKDIHEHFEFLLEVLLPHGDALAKAVLGGGTSFDVLWESTYLHAGTGPVMSARVCEGIGALHADLGFDIYQKDEDEGQAG